MALTPLSPLDPSSPTFRADVDNFFRSAMPNMVNEVNALQGNLNSIAAGGAFAIPLVGWADGDSVKGGQGRLTIAGPQNTNVNLYFNSLDARGGNLAAVLSALYSTGWTSSPRGFLSLTVVNDPARKIYYQVNNYGEDAQNSRLILGVSFISSTGSPILAGDSLVMQCTRNGANGVSTVSQTAKFSDRQAPGTQGGAGAGATFGQVRTLNTVEWNTMPSFATLGGSYGANVFVLQPGTYLLTGRAPALGVGGHKAAVFNESDNQYLLMGCSAYSGGTGAPVQSDSTLSGYFTLTAPKAFTVRHFLSTGSSSTSTLGNAAGGGQIETYTEIFITKVA